VNADDARKWFAEDLRLICGLTSSRLVDAIATVPRERFLPPGPWQFRGTLDLAPRVTDDDDPRHVYHDVPLAIIPERNLYNGQPSLIARWIEQLQVDEGARVLHIGCGTGYFSAWLAHIVGAAGSVFAIEVDPDLARRAAENLRPYHWVEVAAGDGLSGLPGDVDVVLIHAGASHLHDEWLDAATDGGQLLVPMTFALPGMLAGIGKGMVLHATRTGSDWTARFSMPVMIYSLIGARSDEAQAALGTALMAGTFQQVKRLRRDPHEPGPACWLHGATNCLATA
jgi:protein-L-isoaspartate(D-aspartate) O-methyltransferase